MAALSDEIWAGRCQFACGLGISPQSLQRRLGSVLKHRCSGQDVESIICRLYLELQRHRWR